MQRPRSLVRAVSAASALAVTVLAALLFSPVAGALSARFVVNDGDTYSRRPRVTAGDGGWSPFFRPAVVVWDGGSIVAGHRADPGHDFPTQTLSLVPRVCESYRVVHRRSQDRRHARRSPVRGRRPLPFRRRPEPLRGAGRRRRLPRRRLRRRRLRRAQDLLLGAPGGGLPRRSARGPSGQRTGDVRGDAPGLRRPAPVLLGQVRRRAGGPRRRRPHRRHRGQSRPSVLPVGRRAPHQCRQRCDGVGRRPCAERAALAVLPLRDAPARRGRRVGRLAALRGIQDALSGCR